MFNNSACHIATLLLEPTHSLVQAAKHSHDNRSLQQQVDAKGLERLWCCKSPLVHAIRISMQVSPRSATKRPRLALRPLNLCTLLDEGRQCDPAWVTAQVRAFQFLCNH